jgi:hypothetical protein
MTDKCADAEAWNTRFIPGIPSGLELYTKDDALVRQLGWFAIDELSTPKGFENFSSSIEDENDPYILEQLKLCQYVRNCRCGHEIDNLYVVTDGREYMVLGSTCQKRFAPAIKLECTVCKRYNVVSTKRNSTTVIICPRCIKAANIL